MPSDDAGMDRRSYLKYAGVATVTAMAGCSGGGGGGGGGATNHKAPHPTDTVPQTEQNAKALNGQSRPDTPNQSKSAVGFQHSPNGEQHCGNCSLYVPDQNGDGYGACTLVQGTIHACDWCSLWSSFGGENTIPCGD
ncbi:MAG: high-potential iron-sulfur protein [Halodesulfurarchaeum sp.]